MAEELWRINPLSFWEGGFNFYRTEMIILSVNGQTVINTISHAITCFNNIKDAIEYMGVTVGSSTADGYPDLIKSIQGDSAELIDDLNDIYLAITARGGTCVEGQYDTYAQGVLSITCDDTVLLLQNYLEDIYNAILIRGGHCEHLAYDQYDTGVLSINTSSSMAYLQSCLADIYDAIVEQGSTATENDYSTYAQGVLDIETSSSEVEELEAQVAALQAQVASLQSQITTKDATISSLQSQVSTLTSQVSSLQSTITTYQSDFSDIASAITTMGGTVVDSSAYGDYDTYVLSIPTGSGQISTLEGYLADVYTAISNNTVGVTCTSGNYSDYDAAIGRIYTAYNGQISTLNGTITTYVADFADIATAIGTMGGTVTDSTAYADFDTYVLSIPTSGGGGDLDRLKPYIHEIDAAEINGTYKFIVTNGNNMFADMTNLDTLYGEFDLSTCTDVTDMFKNCTSLGGPDGTPKIKNFGNSSNADLILDLSYNDDIVLSNMLDVGIAKYTRSPDGNVHVRKILLSQNAYDNNQGYGDIARMRNKGITVQVKPSS